MTAIGMTCFRDNQTASPAQTVAAEPRRWPVLLGAGGLSLVLHGVLFLLLTWNGSGAPATPPVPPVLITHLVALQPAPQPAPLSTPMTVPTPVTPVAPTPAEDTKLARPRVDDQRRAEQQRLEQQRQRVRAERLEQARLEQARLEQARLEQARLEQARLEQAHLAQRQAAIAEAEQARLAAERWAANNHDYAPLDKPAPEYPERALARGIEGDCTVQYTIDAAGRVENPAVVGDCHPLFIRASLNAVKAFRYQPRRVDGQPQAVANVRNTFHYRIEGQRRR